MFNKFKHMKNEKGLTLIELLAVVVILGIIAAIAIPAIGNIIENSRSKAVISDAINVMNAGQLYFTENPTVTAYDKTITNYKDFLEAEGKIKTFSVAKTPGAANKITFTADINGKPDVSFTGITLDDLTKATVSKGVIKIGATEYGK